MKSYFLILTLCIHLIYSKESLIRLPRATERTSRIIGGEVARAGQFPWYAAIYKDTADGRYFCAGTLISEQWILTAAQCVYEATQFVIQLGSNQLQSEDVNRVTVATSTYVIHEEFDPSNLAHDIGLIKLRLPVTLTEYIQPIGYANVGYLYAGRIVDSVGWGQTSDSSSELSNDLRYAEVVIMDQYQCRLYFGDQVWAGMICTQGSYNEGTCYGDIGGALVTPVHDWVGNHSVAVAVASWISQNGCESLDPKGHTRTELYYDWIFNATRDN